MTWMTITGYVSPCIRRPRRGNTASIPADETSRPQQPRLCLSPVALRRYLSSYVALPRFLLLSGEADLGHPGDRAHGHFWASLAGPFVIFGIGTASAFIPVSIA